jgi:tetratricopeptide (TPR) repeat protein
MALFPSAKVLFPSAEEDTCEAGKYPYPGVLTSMIIISLSITDPKRSVGGDSGWLENASYQPAPTALSTDSVAAGGGKTREEIRHKSIGTKRKRKEGSEAKDTKTKIFVQTTSDGVKASGADYQIDSKADTGNLHYDGLYSGDIALYRRRFAVVGLGQNQWVELNDGRSKGKDKIKKEKQLRYFKGVSVGERELIRLTIGKKIECEDLEFLDLEMKLSAESAENQTLETHGSQLSSEYNRSLLNEPHNVDLWMEFIALQDQLGGWGQADHEKVGKVKRAVLERKVAIFERALESNPTSVELLIGYMELVREFWETEKVVRNWKDIVFHQPHKAQLWLHYIHFCQTSFSSFTVSSQLALYRKCTSTLVSILRGSLQSHKPEPDALDQLLRILSLYCQFLQQAGHSEKAVACYQALIEFNLCYPRELNQETFKTRLEFFETYWDSGCPRFGERDALGWNNWTMANQRGSPNSSKLGLLDVSAFLEVAESEKRESGLEEEDIDPDVLMIAGQSVPEAWLSLEVHRTVEQCLPWRPDESKGESEEDCTDPDRLVLFDDVSPTLFDVHEPASQLKLVLGFIQFLGGPFPTPTSQTTATAMESLNQISLDLLHNLSCLSDQSVQTLHFAGFSSLSPSSLRELGAQVSRQLLCTVAPESVKCTPSIHNTIVTALNHSLGLFSDAAMQTKLVQILITFLLQQLRGSLMAESKLSKQTRSTMKAVQKLAKNVLRLEQHRNNLSLWNCCALIEYLLGNFQDSSRLYQSLLSQHSTPIPQLTCSYCECLLGIQGTLMKSQPPQSHPEQTTMALHAIVCLTEGKYSTLDGASVSAARVLRARSKFEQKSEQADSVFDILCHCYFEYLTRGLEAASTVFNKWIATKSSEIQHLARESPEHTSILRTLEQLFTKQIALVELHSSLHPSTPPKLMRSLLEKALATFPDHTLFLAKFIEAEQKSFISGRLRRFFDSNTSTCSSVRPWLYSIAAELQRYCHLQDSSGLQLAEETTTGTVHRITSLLSRATDSTSGQHCPLLWRMYMVVLVRKHTPVVIQCCV